MLRSLLTGTVVIASLASPAAAGAASLGGAPELTRVDSHHARLHFAAHDVPRRSDGTLAVTVRFAGGQRVSALKATGKRHGEDPIYTTRVTSSHAWRVGTKYTVRFAFGDGKTTQVLVKLR